MSDEHEWSKRQEMLKRDLHMMKEGKTEERGGGVISRALHRREVEHLRGEVAAFRIAIGANEGESTVDALHRYTFAVQLGCALKLEQRAKEIAEQPPLLPVDKIREVTVAALVGGAALLRQGVPAAAVPVLSAHVDKADEPWCHNPGCIHRGQCYEARRYPCSPTCTHDDAATPGHPDRVKERSEDVTGILAVPSTDCCEQAEEAMLAACLEAAREWAARNGIVGVAFDLGLKAAIEGAAP